MRFSDGKMAFLPPLPPLFFNKGVCARVKGKKDPSTKTAKKYL
jgi:hypothetical protein